MFIRRLPVAAILVLTLIGFAGIVTAQDISSKQIRLATGGPGSNGDFASRLIAQGLSANIGQQVIVDNRPSGVILGELVAKAPADGHTLLVTGSSFWLAPFFQNNLPWDPTKDFLPVILAVSSPSILVVHPSLPVKSVKELIAFAKSRPGRLNYASGPAGNANHLAAELFKSMARVDIVRVPYKSIAPARIDLIAGQVQLMFPTAASIMTHVNSGRLRALAVLSAQPSALAPGLPTASESGLPGFEAEVIIGMFVPAKTPAALITRLNQEIARVLNQPDIKQKFFAGGQDVTAGAPERLAAAVKNDMSVLGKLIKDLELRNE